jgi:hypothetical protein
MMCQFSFFNHKFERIERLASDAPARLPIGKEAASGEDWRGIDDGGFFYRLVGR